MSTTVRIQGAIYLPGLALARRLAIVALLAGLTACGNLLDADICPDVGPAASDPPAKRNCGPGFFSAKKQREILYSGNDVPRLYDGEPERVGPVIDATAANPPPPFARPIAAYSGSLRVELASDATKVAADIKDIRNSGAKRFDPNETVKVDLNRATLDYMLQQLLGGALGVNYLTPENLGGSVTFRTEEPVPKGQILLVVRDILARSGLMMKYVNGVYHIGRPELIAGMEATAAAGEVNELVTRFVKLPRGSAHEVVAFARPLYADTVILQPTNIPRTIIVRAAPGDIDQVEETLKLIASGAVSEDRVAIIPLTQAGPDRVATKLAELYQARLPPGSDQPTIIPLERQQAIMVAVKDPAMMQAIRQLTKELDHEDSDGPTLRIIPLRNLGAEEIAQQLQAIFTTGGAVVGAGPRRGVGFGDRGRERVIAELPPLLPPGQLTPLLSPAQQAEQAQREEDGGAAVAPPGSPAGAVGRRFPAAAGVRGPRGGVAVLPAGAGAENIRIVADTRNNSLMVYSTYAIFRRIRDVVRSLDVPQSQVAIEATVVEVDLNDRLDRGVQFFLQSPYVNARSSVQPAPVDLGRPGGFLQVGANFGNYRADMVLTALQEITATKVISSPYLTVLDGKTARLVIGDQIPYTVRSQTSQNVGNVTVTEDVEIKDTGIILEVTPRINSNNSVTMKISQTVSTPSPTAQAGNTTPIIATRSVDSNVLVQSGRTIMLGGLIQDRIEKRDIGLPILGRAPIIGDLFKTKDDRVKRVELIVMITPRVSRQSSQIEAITRLIKSQFHTR